MRLPDFEYLQPESLKEVLDLLAEHGDEASLLAGGTDLLVRLRQRLGTPTHLISNFSLVPYPIIPLKIMTHLAG